MPIVIQSPVHGTWKLHTPGGHHPYSKDFRALDVRYRELGTLEKLRWRLGRIDVSAFSSWAQTVLAPLSGTVVHVSQDHPDRSQLNHLGDWLGNRLAARRGGNDPGHWLGNHLVLEADSGHHLLFAHLKQSSIRVVPGQAVAAGEALAKVGNSGISLTPHLHFHITDPTANNPDQPVAFVFDQYETLDGGIWHPARSLLPADHTPFRSNTGRREA